jgi:purine catabolism regulator
VIHTAEDLPEAYRQAIRAVHAGAQVHGPESLTHFDRLGAFRILSLVQDASELKAFAHETLGALAGGTPEQVELRRTLEMLLETGLNVAEAARRMFCHYNTIRYRVEKIERQLGPFQDDARLRLDISLALRILEMNNVP